MWVGLDMGVADSGALGLSTSRLKPQKEVHPALWSAEVFRGSFPSLGPDHSRPPLLSATGVTTPIPCPNALAFLRGTTTRYTSAKSPVPVSAVSLGPFAADAPLLFLRTLPLRLLDAMVMATGEPGAGAEPPPGATPPPFPESG